LNCVVQGGSDKSGIIIWFFKNDTAHLKTIRFDSNKNWLAEERTENQFFSMKLSSAATAASILCLNLLQYFCLVFLARNPITSFI
jgi:hypothetical protein